MSFGTPPSPPPVILPNAPNPPPMFGSQTTPGQKPQAKPSQPTFLGGLTAGKQNLGYRTLLGGGSSS